uniref:Homing endonuclease LAGLIDADG domain-containing protein n=1 Tax=Ogataea polymorpha TaxID=460523 RepID=S5U3N7_9ASCO|nr:hypothetical protein [Ogataea polymorpha]AGS44028.1 hypothetical protein [Ogataea polymorpha]
MVTRYKIHENEMGNRGSKSLLINSVKEQRVYGSYRNFLFPKQINQFRLRCTLTACESKCQVKIPSKFNLNKTSILDPWFVTGLTDSEGYFLLKKHRSSFQCQFGITLHSTDKQLVSDIYKFFNCGTLNLNKKRNVCIFQTSSINDLVNKIIPHFEMYPLQTQKKADFLLFKEAVLLKLNKHLNVEDFIKLKASMNRGLSLKLKDTYPNIIPTIRPTIFLNKNWAPMWIAGFVSGDGGFYISIVKNKYLKFRFVICQNIRDKELIEYFKIYFKCGTLYQNKKDNCIYYTVTNKDELRNIIAPFFSTWKVKGIKYNNFVKWLHILELYKGKQLKNEDLLKIKEIINSMNSYYLINLKEKQMNIDDLN